MPNAADPPPGYAMLPPSMGASLPSNTTSLLAGVGVGRVMITQRMLSRPPGLHQVRHQLNPQRPVIPAVPEATQSSPYRQQVPAPWVPWPDTGTRLCTAAETTQPSTTTSTTTSTASDMETSCLAWPRDCTPRDLTC